MRSLLYFLIGFALQFVLWLPAYAVDCGEGYTCIKVPQGDAVQGSLTWQQNCIPYDGPEGCGYSYTRITCEPSEIENKVYITSQPFASYCVLSTAYDNEQNGDEEGIDCGGSTGVDCVQSCPDGYILHDGLCYKAAENPYPAGTTMPDGSVSDGEPWLYPGIAADPLLHSPDYTPTSTDWDQVQDYEPAPVLPDTVEYDKSGDYVIRDENGNIVEAQIIGESVSETDNGDGTTTVVTQDKIYKDGQTSITSTTTTVKDNATGEVISQYTEESSDNVSFIGAGRGSTESVTGDQYSKGVESIVDAINGEEEGEGWSDPEYTESDIEYEPLDESQYDYESYIDNFISNNHDIGWLSVISDSGIQTSNPYCSISGDVSIGSTTVPLELSLCDYEDTFQAMGTWLALLVQISALIITFGGLE
jgi:hypothetical protein